MASLTAAGSVVASLRLWLLAATLATSLDMGLSLVRDFHFRTDRPFLIAVLWIAHLALTGAALLVLRFLQPLVRRFRPSWTTSGWTELLALALLPQCAVRVRRLEEPWTLLPEIAGLLVLALLLFLERRGTLPHPGWAGSTLVLALAVAGAYAATALPMPGRELLAPPRAKGATPAAPTAPNLLVIVLDTLRADRLGLYGHHRATSPFLESLGQQALVFEHAVSSSSWTLPAHATLFTGLHPWAHGTDILQGDDRGLPVSQVLSRVSDPLRVQPLSPAATTLAEVAHDAGMETAAICGNTIYLYNVFQLNQGFDTYVDAPGNHMHWIPAGFRLAYEAGLLQWWPFRRSIIRNEQLDRHADEVTQLALEWLDERPGHRFFLFLNYMDVHGPYIMPRSHVGLYAAAGEEVKLDEHAITSGESLLSGDERAILLDSYDAEIRFLDEQLANLFGQLEARGLLEDTVVLITSDHGESFGEHHQLWHGNSVYESELHVPMLLMRLDRKPGRIARTVHMTEVFATLLEEVNLPLPAGTGPARLHTPLPAEPIAPFVIQMDHNNNYERSHTALYQDPWKLIKHSDGGQELYELSTDPAETTDRSLMNPQQAARMSAQLSAYRQRTGLLFPSTEGLLDEETKRRLRTLGYID